MRKGFIKRYLINKQTLPAHKNFGSGSDFIRREDYLGDADQIAPVADPNITSTTMQIYQASAVREAALTTGGYDRDEAQRRWLKALKADNIDSLYVGEEKAKPLPNPKMAAEQLKLQAHQMKIEADKIKWANELLAEQPKIQAEIDLLRAQAAQIVAEIGAARAATQIAAFETAIKAFEAYHGQVSNRIKSLTSGKSDEEGSNSSVKGNVPGLAGPSDQSAAQGPAGGMGGPPQGTMGGGGFPGS